MSLPNKVIDRIFERMVATYGAGWTRMWADVPMADVRVVWAHELAAFCGCTHRIAWAMENLPQRCPNAIEFKALCRQAPTQPAPQLPEPQAAPERVQAELSKLAFVAAAQRQDPKAWAHRIISLHAAGQPVSIASLRCARDAIGSGCL